MVPIGAAYAVGRLSIFVRRFESVFVWGEFNVIYIKYFITYCWLKHWTPPLPIFHAMGWLSFVESDIWITGHRYWAVCDIVLTVAVIVRSTSFAIRLGNTFSAPFASVWSLILGSGWGATKHYAFKNGVMFDFYSVDHRRRRANVTLEGTSRRFPFFIDSGVYWWIERVNANSWEA